MKWTLLFVFLVAATLIILTIENVAMAGTSKVSEEVLNVTDPTVTNKLFDLLLSRQPDGGLSIWEEADKYLDIEHRCPRFTIPKGFFNASRRPVPAGYYYQVNVTLGINHLRARVPFYLLAYFIESPQSPKKRTDFMDAELVPFN